MLEAHIHGSDGFASAPRCHRAIKIAAILVVAFLASSVPAKADHIVAYTLSASNCLPASVACASIETVFRYHQEGSLGQYTILTTATGRALVAPGTLDARRSVTQPGDPGPITVTHKCGWDFLGAGCSLSFAELVTAQFPTNFCAEIGFDLSATTRIVDDPVLRLLPVNARVTRTLLICWNGTITPV